MKTVFFIKRNTILLLYMYQVFILLLRHLPFFLHFFFTFMENFFLRQPLSAHLEYPWAWLEPQSLAGAFKTLPETGWSLGCSLWKAIWRLQVSVYPGANWSLLQANCSPKEAGWSIPWGWRDGSMEGCTWIFPLYSTGHRPHPKQMRRTESIFHPQHNK